LRRWGALNVRSQQRTRIRKKRRDPEQSTKTPPNPKLSFVATIGGILMTIVYLHIGRGKTGTTALQIQLNLIRDRLFDSGIRYAWSDDKGSGTGHQNFAKSFISEYPAWMIPAANPKAVREEVQAEIAECVSPKILLSSENFPLCDIGEVKRFFYGIPSVQLVKIILLVRSQDELAESQYNQLVKMKNLTASFEEFAETSLLHADFYKMASEWSDAFGEENIICRIFDAKSINLMDDFLDCIEPLESRNWTGRLSKPDANESVGYFSLQALRLLNRLEIGVDSWQVAQKLLHLSSVDFPALLFGVEEARLFRERFADSNEHFSSRFLSTTLSDLGGRRYTDEERRSIREAICNVSAFDVFETLTGANEQFVRRSAG
jgi:hypothetical protein